MNEVMRTKLSVPRTLFEAREVAGGMKKKGKEDLSLLITNSSLKLHGAPLKEQ